MLKMIGFITRLVQLGWTMDHDLGIDLVLTSLPESYSQFVLNFNMNKIETTLLSLLNILAQVENFVKEKPSIHLVSSKKGSFKKKKKTKKDEVTISKVLKPNGGVKKDKEDVKGTCHHCEKPRHWRHNCKEYIKFVKRKKLRVFSLQVQNHIMICFPHYLVYDTLFLLNWF